MNKPLDKELKKTNQALRRFIQKEPAENKLKQELLKKVPDSLSSLLEKAFFKAFQASFLKGTDLIEKTYNKEDMQLEHQANNYLLTKKTSRKYLKRLNRPAIKNNLLNQTLSTSSGALLGFLGMGLPDIPILVSMLLRGVYQTALSYGFSYEDNLEKCFILQLIRNALSSSNQEVCIENCEQTDLQEEIRITAKALSDALLMEKFIQGIPLVGTVGAIINHQIYHKVSRFAYLTYKKRYLLQLQEK